MRVYNIWNTWSNITGNFWTICWAHHYEQLGTVPFDSPCPLGTCRKLIDSTHLTNSTCLWIQHRVENPKQGVKHITRLMEESLALRSQTRLWEAWKHQHGKKHKEQVLQTTVKQHSSNRQEWNPAKISSYRWDHKYIESLESTQIMLNEHTSMTLQRNSTTNFEETILSALAKPYLKWKKSVVITL